MRQAWSPTSAYLLELPHGDIAMHTEVGSLPTRNWPWRVEPMTNTRRTRASKRRLP
jgi:hypothetical protein